MAHHGESPSTFCRMLGPPSRGDFCSPAELGQQLALTKSPDSSPAKRFPPTTKNSVTSCFAASLTHRVSVNLPNIPKLKLGRSTRSDKCSPAYHAVTPDLRRQGRNSPYLALPVTPITQLYSTATLTTTVSISAAKVVLGHHHPTSNFLLLSFNNTRVNTVETEPQAIGHTSLHKGVLLQTVNFWLSSFNPVGVIFVISYQAIPICFRTWLGHVIMEAERPKIRNILKSIARRRRRAADMQSEVSLEIDASSYEGEREVEYAQNKAAQFQKFTHGKVVV
ncbi:hypothetical protein PGT21_016078 [Puccinia graminis f. sp. tritici]|uniref:Uncharacterized protein n=1 Tax=Puccinia graminis f. sp. tritici TaxID=56615 RepID=A0A5B0P7W8_PUCGR|nr:hypothetical protein PGT21_016078 [Puccinia graminis f. sp. tritici]